MKRALTVAAILLFPTLAVTFYLMQPAERIPERARWILEAESAHLYEMDVIYDSGSPPATVGEHSGKPLIEGVDEPTDNGWRPVEEPRKIHRDLLDSFQQALREFHNERGRPIVYRCEMEPRVCVRFEKPYVVYDVYICLTCRQVLIKDVWQTEVYQGKMDASFASFARAVARVLPRDARTKRALAELGS